MLSIAPIALPATPGSAGTDDLFYITDDVAGLTTLMVNVFFLGHANSDDWVLVDCGIPPYAGKIIRTAGQRFRGPPRAIVLTHGHFDHIGTVHTLLSHWPDVPVYAHELEFPYLTGQAKYPPADPTVGGGMMATTSWMLPHGPIDIRDRLRKLPADDALSAEAGPSAARGGMVPFAPGWRWVHTPGHTPGHVSLFREADRVLIAGDAFVTQKQESIYGVMSQELQIHGPPWYFTPDWPSAYESVKALAHLRPAVAATGHGRPMHNPRLAHDLSRLVRDFRTVGMPAQGRYVMEPAVSGLDGPVYIPPRSGMSPGVKTALIAGAVALGVMFLRGRGPRA